MTRKRREKLIRQYRAERQSLRAARRKWPNLPDAYQRRRADARAGRASPGIATATDTKAAFVIEPPTLLCLDFEASGTDPRCYPMRLQ
jgi:hypothetical protein